MHTINGINFYSCWKQFHSLFERYISRTTLQGRSCFLFVAVQHCRRHCFNLVGRCRTQSFWGYSNLLSTELEVFSSPVYKKVRWKSRQRIYEVDRRMSSCIMDGVIVSCKKSKMIFGKSEYLNAVVMLPLFLHHQKKSHLPDPGESSKTRCTFLFWADVMEFGQMALSQISFRPSPMYSFEVSMDYRYKIR